MKVIAETDLPAIVAGILDGSLGQCEEASQHDAFAAAVADVIADFCGGTVIQVVDTSGNLPLFDPEDAVPVPRPPWRGAVVRNDSLPDDGGVWAGFGSGEIE